jgi:hypothetical protein
MVLSSDPDNKTSLVEEDKGAEGRRTKWREVRGRVWWVWVYLRESWEARNSKRETVEWLEKEAAGDGG